MSHKREVYDAVGKRADDVWLDGCQYDWRRRVVAAIRDRYQGGESLVDLAHDYELSEDKIKTVVETVRRKK